jgi:hypothetical protein
MAEEAVGLVQEMRSKKINPDKVTYGNLVTAMQRMRIISRLLSGLCG